LLRRDSFPVIGIGGALALCVALCYVARREPLQSTGPESLDEVAVIADNLGLHYRSDLKSGEVINRLVMSHYPLTFERANALRVGDSQHPCWQGTVVACHPSRCFKYLTEPDYGVVWGDVFLFGDPELIRQLMSAGAAGTGETS
jgi:hypothetical protein